MEYLQQLGGSGSHPGHLNWFWRAHDTAVWYRDHLRVGRRLRPEHG